MQERIEQAELLVEALPYIRRFHGKTIVIKYGGSLMINEKAKQTFANDVVLLKYVGMNPVIVHGGGKEISRWMKKLGKEVAFIDGLRVTDSETMEITEMVLSGKINSEVVSLINKKGGKAVGLTGKDAQMFNAKKIRSKKDEDLGHVGEVTNVDISVVNTLSAKDYIPVIASIGVSPEGETLNLNADNVAQAVASNLNAMKLMYLTDVNGVIKEDKLLSHLQKSDALDMIKTGEISGGMIPKVECSLSALSGGVRHVHIINGSITHSVLLELFTDVGIGTLISKDND